MRVYDYVLSCRALNGVASQEPSGHGACLVLKSPGSQGGSEMNKQVAKSCPFMIVGGRSGMVCS
jgi:hypothetical protein